VFRVVQVLDFSVIAARKDLYNNKVIYNKFADFED